MESNKKKDFCTLNINKFPKNLRSKIKSNAALYELSMSDFFVKCVEFALDSNFNKKDLEGNNKQ